MYFTWMFDFSFVVISILFTVQVIRKDLQVETELVVATSGGPQNCWWRRRTEMEAQEKNRAAATWKKVVRSTKK